MNSIIANDKAYIAGTYNRYDAALVSGKGSFLYDETGKRYIDLTAGIGVNSFGVCDDAWIAAVTEQLMKMQHCSNLYYSQPDSTLAKLLCEKTGMSKVFFSNSGAEANECAFKVARKYSVQRKGSDCYTILTLENSFHGRTITALSATGQDHYHQLYQPLTPGFAHVKANDIAALETAVKAYSVAGIMLECVQGEGGVLPLTREFVLAAQKIAKENDIPLIIDEVQTGNGRTGKLYAYMHYGICPDIVSTAKGLGGGLPIGATLLSEKVADVLKPGDHGSTYGGNPVCCAGAISILERLTEAFMAEVSQKSQYVFQTLQGSPGIESVTGLGLMIGIKTTKPARNIVTACLEKGVLCLTAKDKIRLLPPLNIPTEALQQAMDILKNTCK